MISAGQAIRARQSRTICFGALLALLAAQVCGADEVFPVAHHEPLTVRVVDGKEGKPVARAHVVLQGGYALDDLRVGLWREEALTDAEGAVRLTDGLRNLPLLRVEVVKHRLCAEIGRASCRERV